MNGLPGGVGIDLHAVVPERGVDVTLRVPSGSTCALIGPNGAGKSTVLGVLAGLVSGGTCSVAGTDLTGWAPHRRRLSLLDQDPLLFDHLTVLDNVAVGLRAQGHSRSSARSAARVWLERLEVGGFADRRPGTLSGGQAQRVAIARALAPQPRAVLLDEPLAALDVDVVVAVREELARRLARTTALLVSHDPTEVLALADRVAVLDRGRLVEEGTVAEVFARPRHPFTVSMVAQLGGVRVQQVRREADRVLVELPAGTVIAPGDRLRVVGSAGRQVGEGDQVGRRATE